MSIKHIGIITLIAVLTACTGKVESGADATVYFCDAEIREVNESNQQVFHTTNMDFKSAETQSSDFAFSGDYSVKLDSTNKYGMSFLITDVKANEYFSATVWQKESETPGALICSVTGESKFVLNSLENGIYHYENGWMQHNIQFTATNDLDSVTFFLFVGGKGGVAYFDDLKVERFSRRPEVLVEDAEILELYVPDSSQMILDDYITKAMKEEIIRDKYKEYVEAAIVHDGDSSNVEMRLKGDWTDHLISGNASYRIKTESGYAYSGLRSFSIQHPRTRNYMHEWFVHKLCDSEGLLSTRYSFVQVKKNGENQGIYALEEHFDKQLLESRNRREGPILKMDETGFWALAILAREQGLEKIEYPFYESSIVSVFKKGRTEKSPTLSAQFNNGVILLNLFKESYDRPDLLFDVKKAAVYYALMDLGNVHHSLAWHNRRFYYDPVSAKLEHIGFDMIPMVKPYNPLIATTEFRKNKAELAPEAKLNHYFFLNPEFRYHYTESLKKMSSETYLDSVFGAFEDEISKNEELLGFELPHYHFDKEMYYTKAALIRNELKTLDARWDEFIENNQSPLPLYGEERYDLGDTPFFIEEISVNAFRSKIDSNRYRVQFENYHFDSVLIDGYSVKQNKDILIPFETPIGLRGFRGDQKADYAEVELDEKPARFFINPLNLVNKLEKKKFIKWKKPMDVHPRIGLHQSFSENSPYYLLRGGKLIFNTGTYQIDQLLYIPDGIEVYFFPGTTIDFVEKGGLITNGSTSFSGTAGQPVKFISSDKTGMGITILNADSVLVNHVVVEDMNTLDYKGWTLTGAFSVYESNVSIDGLEITGNNCEDGLNIIRSSFDISNCYIANTKSDGFDADFCTGTFRSSKFEDTGNDCIDFSGSEVFISDIEIVNSGDKGVSGGERSHLTLSNITITGALTGVASKDDTQIEGDNIQINNVEVGIALFQKKPEYDGAKMNLENVTYQQVGELGLIEKGSQAQINGKTYSGYLKFDIDAMYARFEKK